MDILLPISPPRTTTKTRNKQMSKATARPFTMPKKLVTQIGGLSIWSEETHMLDVRGWGHLMSQLKLSEEEAIKAQTDFGNEVANRYNAYDDAIASKLACDATINEQGDELEELRNIVYAFADSLKQTAYGNAGDDFKKLAWMTEQYIAKQKETCQHEHDGKVYVSMPPQYKCKKCGVMYTKEEQKETTT